MSKKTEKSFGQVLREAREGKFTLRKFAIEIDVSPTYLSQVEQGNAAPPTADRVKKMAGLLGADADAWIALAGRMPEDLPEIIRKEPTAVPDLLRAVRGLTVDQIRQLRQNAEEMRNEGRHHGKTD